MIIFKSRTTNEHSYEVFVESIIAMKIEEKTQKNIEIQYQKMIILVCGLLEK